VLVPQELGRGDLEQVLVKGAQGYVLMTHAGPNTVVTVVTADAISKIM